LSVRTIRAGLPTDTEEAFQIIVFIDNFYGTVIAIC
jgi:hypothetical protein